MGDMMKDEIDPPYSTSRRGAAGQVGLSVLLSVLCSVPLTLVIVRYGSVDRPGPGPFFREMTPDTVAQAGKFKVVAGQEGAVNFPIPYAYPPSVETDAGSFNKTVIVETTTQGFRWKNTGESNVFNDTDVHWTAKGLVHQP